MGARKYGMIWAIKTREKLLSVVRRS